MTTARARDRPTDRPDPARLGSVRARALGFGPWLCGVDTYIFGPENTAIFEPVFKSGK